MAASLLGAWVACETCEHVDHVSEMWSLKLRGPEGPRGWTCRDWRGCEVRRTRNRGFKWAGENEMLLHLFPSNVGRSS